MGDPSPHSLAILAPVLLAPIPSVLRRGFRQLPQLNKCLGERVRGNPNRPGIPGGLGAGALPRLPSTGTRARRTGTAPWRISRRAVSRWSWPPMWQPVASTSPTWSTSSTSPRGPLCPPPPHVTDPPARSLGPSDCHVAWVRMGAGGPTGWRTSACRPADEHRVVHPPHRPDGPRRQPWKEHQLLL